MVDKWEALDLLTAAATDLGHRTLGVLRALLTFHPGRLLSPWPMEAIVFPSNRTLGGRLAGMPESTLRRHLAALVDAGIVSRRDSPNRKRFARVAGGAAGGPAVAFGLDLSPLARRVGEWRRAAAMARAHAEALAVRRAELGALRADLIAAEGEGPLTDEARRVLRRKPDRAAIDAATAAIVGRLHAFAAGEPDTPRMSADDARNGRHIQHETNHFPDSEGQGGKGHDPAPDAGQAGNLAPCHEKKGEAAEGTPDLGRVLDACTEYRCYFPDPVRTWRDLVRVADRIAPMIGIDPPVFREAAAAMGPAEASVAVLCILEDMGRIRSPGAYLRRLARTARSGGFRIEPLLSALTARTLSADNRNQTLSSMS